MLMMVGTAILQINGSTGASVSCLYLRACASFSIDYRPFTYFLLLFSIGRGRRFVKRAGSKKAAARGGDLSLGTQDGKHKQRADQDGDGE